MYKLRNVNEDIVEHLIYDLLQEYSDICKCEKCVLDIKAIALNMMDSKYVVTDKGELFQKAKYQFNNQEIVNATKYITQAIELVSRNPRH